MAGLSFPTTIEFAPDGPVFVAEGGSTWPTRPYMPARLLSLIPPASWTWLLHRLGRLPKADTLLIWPLSGTVEAEDFTVDVSKHPVAHDVPGQDVTLTGENVWSRDPHDGVSVLRADRPV